MPTSGPEFEVEDEVGSRNVQMVNNPNTTSLNRERWSKGLCGDTIYNIYNA
jgi:hypothetical protein